MGSVQKMLTQMKNRMLTIKTLTGGEGLTIRAKDLTGILEELCRSIIKSDEYQSKSRAEPLQLQVEHLQTLLYAKDQ